MRGDKDLLTQPVADLIDNTIRDTFTGRCIRVITLSPSIGAALVHGGRPPHPGTNNLFFGCNARYRVTRDPRTHRLHYA